MKNLVLLTILVFLPFAQVNFTNIQFKHTQHTDYHLLNILIRILQLCCVAGYGEIQHKTHLIKGKPGINVLSLLVRDPFGSDGLDP